MNEVASAEEDEMSNWMRVQQSVRVKMGRKGKNEKEEERPQHPVFPAGHPCKY